MNPKVKNVLLISLKAAVAALLVDAALAAKLPTVFSIHTREGLWNLLTLAGSVILAAEVKVWVPILLNWSKTSVDPVLPAHKLNAIAKKTAALVVATTLILSGCASVYRPKAPIPTSVFSVPYLADLSSPTLFRDYDAMIEGPAKVARRNAILWEYVYLTNQTYGSYEESFFSGQAFIATGADFLNIALSSTAAVTGTAHLKSILAVVSGSVIGMRASYEKNFYDLATREAIVQVMRSSRLEQLAVIETGMASCSTSGPCGAAGVGYSLEQGLLDVGDYFDRGTVLGALMTITTSSSQQAGAARLVMKTIRRN